MSVSNKKILNQNFHFKIRKKTLFFNQKKIKIDIFASKVMSGLPTVKKIIEKALFVIKKRTFC